jgi:hypothetical protein
MQIPPLRCGMTMEGVWWESEEVALVNHVLKSEMWLPLPTMDDPDLDTRCCCCSV